VTAAAWPAGPLTTRVSFQPGPAGGPARPPATAARPSAGRRAAAYRPPPPPRRQRRPRLSVAMPSLARRRRLACQAAAAAALASEESDHDASTRKPPEFLSAGVRCRDSESAGAVTVAPWHAGGESRPGELAVTSRKGTRPGARRSTARARLVTSVNLNLKARDSDSESDALLSMGFKVPLTRRQRVFPGPD
jgi:hypothetical protein